MDPATLQVWISRLSGVADEMGAVLRRAAYSPNIKERADCSCALFAPDGSCSRRPSTSRCISVRCRRRCAPRSTRCGARTRARRPDRRQRSVRGRHASERHHVRRARLRRRRDAARLGREPRAPRRRRRHGAGLAAARRDRDLPGGTAHPAGALDARGRGARRGRVAHARGAARRSRRAARREPPRRRRGCASCRSSPPRCSTEIVDYGERRARAAIARAARRRVPLRRRARLDRRAGTGASGADLRERHGARRHRSRSTSPAPTRNAPGSVNAVEAVTVSAVVFALRSVVDPDLPANGGVLRPVRVLAPAGSIVAARMPVAVGAGNVEVSQRVADVCLGALAQAAPDRVGGASQGTMNNVLVGGDGWVYYETIGGGQGGRPGRAAGHERRAHRDDEHARHAGRGVRARVPDAGAALRVAHRGAAARAPRPAATASCASSRCSRTRRSR